MGSTETRSQYRKEISASESATSVPTWPEVDLDAKCGVNQCGTAPRSNNRCCQDFQGNDMRILAGIVQSLRVDTIAYSNHLIEIKMVSRSVREKMNDSGPLAQHGQ